jgi:hypothetical protein
MKPVSTLGEQKTLTLEIPPSTPPPFMCYSSYVVVLSLKDNAHRIESCLSHIIYYLRL